MFRFHGTKCALLALSLAFGAACEGWQDGEPFEAATNTAMSQRTFTQRERLANPLVSEVTVRKARHHLYNLGSPSTDVAQFRDDVNAFVTGVAGRDPALANAISGALLPDMTAQVFFEVDAARDALTVPANAVHTAPDGRSFVRVPTEAGRYAEFFAQLAASIRDGAPVPVDARHALATVRILEEAHRRDRG